MTPIALTLGPVFFHWPRERLGDFYRRIADEAPIERVHIGEVVCGKRMPFSDPVWPELIERLEQGGKQVVLSTLAAPATARECHAMADLCADDRLVEVNDASALSGRAGRPFVAGPFLNIYNGPAAEFLVRYGARTICPPIELSLAHVGAIAAACTDAEFELFAFGRLPLAVSGRCYHARLHGRHRDSCQFVCEQDPDGLRVETLDGRPFLAINGVQTLSAPVHIAVPSPAELAAARISRLRLSPQTCDMIAAARLYRSMIDGDIEPAAARARLSELDLPGTPIDGYLRGRYGAEAAPSDGAIG